MSDEGGIRNSPRMGGTALLGRESELRAAIGRLRATDVPLVTLSGREGSGRTSLGAAAVDAIAPDIPGGVLTLAMPGLVGREGLILSLAEALHLTHAPGQPMDAAIAQRLGQLATVVLCDDADGRGEELQLLLDLVRPGGGRVLATARRPLGIPGEHVIRIAPLGLPATDDVGDLERSPAVRLYLRQASAADHRFAPDAAGLAAIAEVCRRLDGLPGAIELAAARVTVLPPRAFLRALDRAPLDAGIRPISRSAGRDTNVMGAALASIHQTLSEDSVAVLRRLSILAGDPTLDDIERIAADPEWDAARVVEAVADLVDCHLLLATTDTRDGFRLPVAVRAFARARLETSGETRLAARRRDAWCLVLMAGAGDHFDGPPIRTTSEDLLASLASLLDADDVAGALTLAADCAPRWSAETWGPEARRLHDAAIARAANAGVSPVIRLRAEIWHARLTTDQVDVPPPAELTSTFNALVTGARETGDGPLLLLALASQVLAVPQTQDFAGTAAAVQEGIVLAHQVGDPYWGTRFLYWSGMIATRMQNPQMASVLGGQGLSEALAANDLRAIVPSSLLLHELRDAGFPTPPWVPSLDDLLALTREGDDPVTEGWVLGFMAQRAVDDGDPDRAVQRAIELIHCGQRTGAWPICLIAFAVLAQVAIARGELAMAAHLTGMFHRDLALLLTLTQDAGGRRFLGRLEAGRTAAGAETWDRGVAVGAGLSPAAALREALRWAVDSQPTAPAASDAPAAADTPVGASDATDEPLTAREMDVLRHIAEGDSNKDIARALNMSPKTVMHHSMSIYRKLGVRGRSEATAWAYRRGLMGAPRDA